MRLSHSLISTFEQCKLRYKYQYIDRIPRKPSIEGYFGQVMHDILESLYKNPKPLGDVLKEFVTKWDANWDVNIILNKGRTQESFKEKGLELLTAFYTKHQPFTQEKVIALETNKFLDIDTDTYAIRIDKISTDSRHIILSDYKTGRPKQKKELVDDRQLLLYAAWARTQFQKPLQLRWHFLVGGTDIILTPEQKQIDGAIEQVKRTAQQIKKTYDYPPYKSRLCDWCPYKDICPVWNDRVWTKQSTLDGF